ncbi:MAG: hypothetical protein VKJ02_01730 [Snowella sp.]|nr:hypothetical protein [Snowella sp.]
MVFQRISSPILANTAEIPQLSSALAPSSSSCWSLQSPCLWSNVILGLSLLMTGAFCKCRLSQSHKLLTLQLKTNQSLNEQLTQAIALASNREQEKDLIDARNFNLDYTRMRMDEEVFHYVVMNQIKTNISAMISKAVQPQIEEGEKPENYRGINELFEVYYDVEAPEGKWKKGILFRIQVKLAKLPTQSTTKIISELVDNIEGFLTRSTQQSLWESTIHDTDISLVWDEMAKPIPLIVLEQSAQNNIIALGQSSNTTSQISP